MCAPDASSIKHSEPIRAAEYVRMSTEHQQYSTENQRDAVRQWAEARNRRVVRTYVDEDRSGLTELAEAQVSTIRTKLLKIGAQIRVTVRKVWVSMASSYPWQDLYQQVWTNLRC